MSTFYSEQVTLLENMIWLSPSTPLHETLMASAILKMDRNPSSSKSGGLSKLDAVRDIREFASDQAKDVLAVWSHILRNADRSKGSNSRGVAILKDTIFAAREQLANFPRPDEWTQHILEARFGVTPIVVLSWPITWLRYKC